MSQMVLPQNLQNSAPSEAAKASKSGNEKSGESSFDAVSRTEQKRLEAKEAREAQEAKQLEKNQAERNQESDESRQADAQAAKPDNSDKSADAKGSEGKSAETESSSEEAGQNLAADDSRMDESSKNPDQSKSPDDDSVLLTANESGVDNVPVTFAGLQSLVASAQSQGATTGNGATVNGQGLPFVQGSLMSMSGLTGGGKNGPMPLQTAGQGGSVTGMALAETMLAGVTAEGGKASDSPMLQNAIRFQGALESAGAQANVVNTPKMAPDAPILRGYATSIDVPVSHAEWGDKIAGKLTWLTARNMSVAEIHLTPPDMGPMEVRVQVQQDQANITVHSANAVVRDQLELHSHRLRDMLNEQGFSLEQFDVSDSGRDQTRDGEAGGGEQSGTGMFADLESEEGAAESQSLDLTWKGEVDIFA